MSEEKDIQPFNIHIGVENFGPIEKAEIDLRPLTVFVGESNTGKTYLGALIYSLHKMVEDGTEGLFSTNEINCNVANVVSQRIKDSFNLNSIAELKRFTCKPKDVMRISLTVNGSSEPTLQLNWTFDNNPINSPTENRIVSHENIKFRQSVTYDYNSRKHPEIYFLPAGRRGIIYAYEDIYTSLDSEKKHIGLQNLPILTEWIEEFIKNIRLYDDRRVVKNSILSIAKDVEIEILCGEIELERSEQMDFPEILFRPHKAEQTLRMNQTSSTVSELAPLVLFLRGVVKPGDTLIIEEPEAHLHPRAQTKIAITLARLVRAGVRVVITTHSEWLLEQIGNLVREGEAMKLRKNQTEPETWLTEEEVGAWLFHVDKPVEEIKFDRIEGYNPPDYYEVASGLYNNAVEYQQQLKEDEN